GEYLSFDGKDLPIGPSADQNATEPREKPRKSCVFALEFFHWRAVMDRVDLGVGVAGIYVRDQDEAIDFYVGKLGFAVHTDARNGDYRWLTVHHPDQLGFQLGLFRPQPPTVDEATARQLDEVVAKGAMPPLVMLVKDCHAAHAIFAAKGVEFTQEPIRRFGNVDASFRDPSGNGWKLVEPR
ncbi:VOC family protein, partial [Brucella tritici]|uniref:VOC family protein n=1 Tax=Brucella tritici TaxID=94626 RepID=UPI001F3C2A7D